MQRRSLIRYSLLMLSVAALLIATAVGMTLAVDPYGNFHGVRWEGVNAKKPAAYAHARLAKQSMARRISPKTVLLGNSRVDIGFDPLSDAWPETAGPVFNLSIPGQGIGGDLRNLQNVFGEMPPRTIVIGIDFLDFLYDGSAGQRSDQKDDPPLILQRLEQFSRTAMSLTALSDTLRTLRLQSNANAENMTENGFNPFRQYLDFVRQEGHHAIFLQRNVENFRTYLRKPKSVMASDSTRSPSFDELRELLGWAATRGVTTHLVIYPYHFDILEGFRETGLWPVFEDWKRHLVELLADQPDRVSVVPPRLWDFSGYHRFAVEPVPISGDTKTHMRWYWEAGHFKSALGDLMLRRLLSGEASATHTDSKDFGVMLTPQNVETVIRSIRAGGVSYRQANPEAGAHVRRLVDKLR